MKISLGIDDFKELVDKKYDFVDKTLFIREMLDDPSKTMLITRPRRFGKTLNLSMLYYFLTQDNAAGNRALFRGLKIGSAPLSDGQDCMEHQGQYLVVMMTLKGIREGTFDDFCGALGMLMSHIYRQHDYLSITDKLDDEEKQFFNRIKTQKASHIDLKRSLFCLTMFLYKHHQQKVILLLDEYDTPFHEAYTSKKGAYHEDVVDFMKVFLGETLKGNPYLEKAVITGILRVSLMNLFSGANSVPVHSMLTQRYATHFGFTEEEVTEYIGRYDKPLDRDAIKAWYNGYQIAGITLYNPWSILRCLSENGVVRAYWCQTGETSTLGVALKSSHFQVKDDLLKLLKGIPVSTHIDERAVFTDLTRNSYALWGLMLFSGYLKVIQAELKHNDMLYTIAIPNREVASGIQYMMRNWFDDIEPTVYQNLIRCIAQSRLDEFAGMLQRYLDESASYHDLGQKTVEKVYHMLLFGMFFVLQDHYFVDSNKEAGLGRPDITLIPKPSNPNRVGIIFEFKATREVSQLETEVEGALKQIDQNRYKAALEKHAVTKALHVGMAFCGREMRMRTEEQDYVSAPRPVVSTLFQPMQYKRAAETREAEPVLKTARLEK
ncbi:MAG: hypothetical protein A3C55_06445 [Gammaproteobacteria bacterium RIFCSPHIGHO2_02_FULL_42_13]|nr:MAG: hypothetical protein A3C55_06445 [Gammaproteobacteria bacterium RIFCSPHIGHO2_02_FULL_42_13]